MSTCSQVDDYLAGRLGNGDTAAFEAHAVTCENCAKAVARRKAVERAAKVMRRNDTSRGPGLSPTSTAYFDQPAPPPVAPVQPSAVGTPDYDRPTSGSQRRMRLLVSGGVGLVVLVSGLLLFWWNGGEPKIDAPAVAVAPTPSRPEPDAPPIDARSPEVASPEVPPPQVPTPELAAPPPTHVADKPPEPTPPVVAAPVAAPTAVSAPAVDPKLEFYPVGTDYELLAETIAGKKCGMAVSALRARVTKDPTEARTWSLLTQCYVKRKRWKNAVDAYDMVVKYGDQTMIDSLGESVEKARAGVQANAAAAEPAPTPLPVE